MKSRWCPIEFVAFVLVLLASSVQGGVKVTAIGRDGSTVIANGVGSNSDVLVVAIAEGKSIAEAVAIATGCSKAESIAIAKNLSTAKSIAEASRCSHAKAIAEVLDCDDASATALAVACSRVVARAHATRTAGRCCSSLARPRPPWDRRPSGVTQGRFFFPSQRIHGFRPPHDPWFE